MAGEAKDKRSGSSGGGFLLGLVITVLMGTGAGAGYGMMFPAGREATQAVDKAKIEAGDASEKDKAAKPAGGDATKEQLVPLDPIIVNLAPPSGWVRLEASVVFATPPGDDRAVLVAHMAQDLSGFLRSTPVRQLETSSGLEFLREDLSELVRLRSKGRARGMVLRSLVIE